MSAYIVANAHIHALLTYAIDHRVSYFVPDAPINKCRVTIAADNAEEVGRVLLDENVQSVNYRYEGRLDDEEKQSAEQYRFRRFKRRLTAVEAIKACHCLSYQSCEHPGWDKSLAWRILEAIKDSASHDLPGYDAAPWGIDYDTWDKAQQSRS